MVGTSRAVTNDSIDEESKDVYRHEEKLEAILVLDSCFHIVTSKKFVFFNYDKKTLFSFTIFFVDASREIFLGPVMKILVMLWPLLFPLSISLSFPSAHGVRRATAFCHAF